MPTVNARSLQVQRSLPKNSARENLGSPQPIASSTIQQAQRNASSLNSNQLLTLQRTVGNRAVSSMLQRSRPLSSSRSTQKRGNDAERETETRASGPDGGIVSQETEKRIRQSQGGGSPLSQEIRRSLEPQLNADLGAVRVHTGGEAVQLSRDVGAKAFTTGSHIYYGQGQSPNDLRLTAHEAVHTIQQSSTPALQRSAAPMIQRKPGKSFNDPKQYKDPEIRSKDRRTNKVLPAGTQIYPYDSGTGTIDQNSVNVTSSYALNGNEPAKSGNVSGANEPGLLIEDSSYWVPKASVNKQKGAYHTHGNLEGLTANTTVHDFDENGEAITRNEPSLPKVEDVIQSAIGDCWLEAALISIVDRNPKFIQTMMRDEGATVTVRLFDVNRKNPKKPTFKPRFIRVNKSTVRRGGEGLYQEGALWAHMIQKAYVAAGYTGQGDRKKGGSKKGNSFNNIHGGHASHAFEIILGQPAKTSQVDSGKAQNKPNMKALPWSPTEIRKYDWTAVPNDNYDGLLTYTDIFNRDKGKVDRWMKWAKKIKNSSAINALYTKRRGNLALMGVGKGQKFAGHKLGYQREVRLEHLEALFQAKNLDNDLIQPLMTYLGRFFPGALGTNKYTERQLEVYNEIKDALDANKVVTASTPAVVGKTSSGKGQSGGESKSKGLVGGHAFAVLGAEEVNGTRLIKIRNPWGSYGREYTMTPKGLRPQEVQDEGTSEIELSDFTKRFIRIQYS